MSRIFKEHYNYFNREILAEFLSPEELEEIDQRYNEAKFQRMFRKAREAMKNKK